MDDVVYIVAEAGVNHNGSIDSAKQLVRVAADAGADAVKFQTFRTDKFVSHYVPKAKYQNADVNVFESQYEMLQRLELDKAAHVLLMQECAALGVEFLSTPFDLDSLALLTGEVDLPRIKLSSGDITDAPFLFAVAKTGKPTILSTGMSTLAEIETALGILAFGYCERIEQPSVKAFERAFHSVEGQKKLQEKVTLLHCTTEYPAPFSDVNLRAMITMGKAFGLRVGYSDHTTGIAIPVAAVALGATVIEKHFTLDRNLPGPDHKASLEPTELKQMVCSIREVESALGSSLKMPAASELKNRSIARKSLVAAQNIQSGEVFTAENLATKRAGEGVSPVLYWEMLGRIASRDYDEDEKVQF